MSDQSDSGKQRTVRPIMIRDIPPQVLDSAGERVMDYSVALLGVRSEGGKQVAHQLGSGTLVQIGQKCYVLTADHVTRSSAFRGMDKLGLGIRRDPHHFSIPMSELSVVAIGSGDVESAGPDLALILLPALRVGSIKANRSFWQMDSYRTRTLPRVTTGVWAVFGCPAEMCSTEVAPVGFGQTMRALGLVGYSGVESEVRRGEFDYLEFPVSYRDGEDVPSSFKGVSGGGLWQIPVRRKSGAEIELLEPILSGVAFYQSEIREGERFLLCHGRYSIYQTLMQRLVEIEGERS